MVGGTPRGTRGCTCAEAGPAGQRTGDGEQLGGDVAALTRVGSWARGRCFESGEQTTTANRFCGKMWKCLLDGDLIVCWQILCCSRQSFSSWYRKPPGVWGPPALCPPGGSSCPFPGPSSDPALLPRGLRPRGNLSGGVLSVPPMGTWVPGAGPETRTWEDHAL